MTTPEPENLQIKKSWAARRKAIKPQAIGLLQDELIEVSYQQPGATLPLVVKPRIKDVDLAVWARDNREFIETNLLTHGGILFRDFEVESQSRFERFLDSVCSQPMVYMEAATPRTKLSEKVYTSTEFPPDQFIAPHNESSYVSIFPMKIWFFCLVPAEQGGETPISDVRKVFQSIPREIKEKFMEKGWMLIRNYQSGFGLSWQTAFHVDSRTKAEAYFRNADMEFEWRPGDRLRTKQVRSAVARHPKTGQTVWFNHIAFWHVSSVEPKLREMLQAEFEEDELPYNTFYGDGSPIEETVIDELRKAYQQATVTFPWQKWDILMLDNISVAHGRNPFVGDRRVLAAMGEPLARTAV